MKFSLLATRISYKNDFLTELSLCRKSVFKVFKNACLKLNVASVFAVPRCGVVWCGVVWCGVVWCGVVWCGVVWCGVVWCGVVWCGVVWCGVVWCGVVWCGVVWCGVVWCGVVLVCWCGCGEMVVLQFFGGVMVWWLIWCDDVVVCVSGFVCSFFYILFAVGIIRVRF